MSMTFTIDDSHAHRPTQSTTFEDLDKAVLDWFSQQRAQGTSVSGPIIANRVKIFFKQLGFQGEVDASSGELTLFKQKHGIREIAIHGGKLSGNEAVSNQFCNTFRELVSSKICCRTDL